MDNLYRDAFAAESKFTEKLRNGDLPFDLKHFRVDPVENMLFYVEDMPEEYADRTDFPIMIPMGRCRRVIFVNNNGHKEKLHYIRYSRLTVDYYNRVRDMVEKQLTNAVRKLAAPLAEIVNNSGMDYFSCNLSVLPEIKREYAKSLSADNITRIKQMFRDAYIEAEDAIPLASNLCHQPVKIPNSISLIRWGVDKKKATPSIVVSVYNEMGCEHDENGKPLDPQTKLKQIVANRLQPMIRALAVEQMPVMSVPVDPKRFFTAEEQNFIRSNRLDASPFVILSILTEACRFASPVSIDGAKWFFNVDENDIRRGNKPRLTDKLYIYLN